MPILSLPGEENTSKIRAEDIGKIRNKDSRDCVKSTAGETGSLGGMRCCDSLDVY